MAAGKRPATQQGNSSSKWTTPPGAATTYRRPPLLVTLLVPTPQPHFGHNPARADRLNVKFQTLQRENCWSRPFRDHAYCHKDGIQTVQFKKKLKSYCLVWSLHFLLCVQMLTLTGQMNSLLLLTHLHVASFSHHETQYVRPCFMQIIPPELQTPPKTRPTSMSKQRLLSLYNIPAVFLSYL